MITEYETPLLHRITGEPGGDHGSDAEGSKQGLIAEYVGQTIALAEPTPVLEIGVVVGGQARTILLKLEGLSRWGSIKGRTGLALMASVAHQVHDGSMVIESTSGNLGVALAGICRDVGVDFTAVVDGRLPPSLRSRLAQLGAEVSEVENTGDGAHLQRRIARVQDILQEDKHAVWTNQYENKANVAVHRWWTGPELGQQLPREAQVVFSPVSTGGSFTGLREYLTAHQPAVECVAVDVEGSTIFGGTPSCRLLTGIGASKPSRFINQGDIPPHVVVSDAAAIASCRSLARDTGIGIGGSSGAVLAGCLRYLSERPYLDYAVCMCPDMASNYGETLYNDEWLTEAGMAEALSRVSVGDEPIHFAGAAGTRPPRSRNGRPARQAAPVLPRN